MTRNTTELRDCLRAAFKRSLKDNTGYQYRYTGVTRPLKGTAFLLSNKGGCRGIVMPRSLIFMSTHKATAARCLRSTAVRVTTLRRLALSVLFIIHHSINATTSYQTTCTVSERTFNKRQHANARYRVESFTHHASRITTLTRGQNILYDDNGITQPVHYFPKTRHWWNENWIALPKRRWNICLLKVWMIQEALYLK